MADCDHPWTKIESKGDGIVECEKCHQRWRGAAAEFVWKRAKDGLCQIVQQFVRLTRMLERDLGILCCTFCGAYFRREGNKHGLKVNGTYVCYACAPDWYDTVAARFEERERRLASMTIARWLVRYCYYNPHTARLYRALEAEITYCLKQEGKLAYAVQ